MKIYLAKERCGGKFEAVRMGFGGLSEEEILEGLEVFLGFGRRLYLNNFIQILHYSTIPYFLALSWSLNIAIAVFILEKPNFS